MVVVIGYTSGSGVLLLSISVAGLHEKTPNPLACSCSVSCVVALLQISVSLNGRVITGLSRMGTLCVTVSIHPLLLCTISVTFLVPVSLYFQAGFCSSELSAC